MKIMMPIPELQAKGLRQQRARSPPSIRVLEKSELTAKVEEKSNTYTFELKD